MCLLQPDAERRNATRGHPWPASPLLPRAKAPRGNAPPRAFLQRRTRMIYEWDRSVNEKIRRRPPRPRFPAPAAPAAATPCRKPCPCRGLRTRAAWRAWKHFPAAPQGPLERDGARWGARGESAIGSKKRAAAPRGNDGPQSVALPAWAGRRMRRRAYACSPFSSSSGASPSSPPSAGGASAPGASAAPSASAMRSMAW